VFFGWGEIDFCPPNLNNATTLRISRFYVVQHVFDMYATLLRRCVFYVVEQGLSYVRNLYA
jgi:hypothetical protein